MSDEDRVFGVDLSRPTFEPGSALPPLPPDPPGVITLRLDVRPFVAAIAKTAEMMRQTMAGITDAAKQVARRMGAIAEVYENERIMLAHGLGNLTGDGQWQSGLCASWLHDSCRWPGLCDCTCHGGSLR
jgi:hypothetical protein